ncbi:phage tail domain-containing protein [Paenibacillus sinopodophylli]|uniref:phage tail domain-containing protein n=1 Tax=Paenibacillus sinopodophylli TaxID=1837342 RepID=UPI00110CBA9F|nr:phage tail domain-containing protein [Paenibacillus sinopodophylli]
MIEVTIEHKGGIDTFSSLGLGLKRRDIPVLPETREYNQTIAGMDGEIDFGVEYGPRVIEHDCVLMADNPTTDYHAKLARIAQIFNARNGDIILTYSDLPDRRYIARYAGTMNIEKIIFDGNLSIPMKMYNPFPESLRDTALKEYGQGLEYGQGYEYSAYSVLVTSSGQSFQIDNQGTTEAFPLVRFTGTCTNLSLSDGQQTFTFGGVMANAVLSVDCSLRKKTVKLNTLNAFSQSNGVFFVLKPGITNFTLTGINPNISIEFIFRHQYLY